MTNVQIKTQCEFQYHKNIKKKFKNIEFSETKDMINDLLPNSP